MVWLYAHTQNQTHVPINHNSQSLDMNIQLVT